MSRLRRICSLIAAVLLAGCAAATVAALRGRSLLVVAVCACAAALLAELLLPLL